MSLNMVHLSQPNVGRKREANGGPFLKAGFGQKKKEEGELGGGVLGGLWVGGCTKRTGIRPARARECDSGAENREYRAARTTKTHRSYGG